MTAWILTTTPDVCALVSAARDIGGPVRAVLVGHSKATLAGVDSLTVMTPDRPDAPPRGRRGSGRRGPGLL